MAPCLLPMLVSLLAIYSVQCAIFKEETTKEGDDKFDWRDQGVIGPVSDQGQLGDAIIYAIAEGVESLYAIQTGQKVVMLSRNEVDDCCDDPFHEPKFRGYDCISHIGGLCTEATYKQIAPQICNNASCLPVGKVTSTGYIPPNREDLMLEVIHQTPLTAVIDAGAANFTYYKTGIFSADDCNTVDLDLVVQIVGYGTTDGQDYWILKNSWGTDWGEQGYMRIVRGKNMCGIASSVFYPINKF